MRDVIRCLTARSTLLSLQKSNVANALLLCPGGELHFFSLTKPCRDYFALYLFLVFSYLPLTACAEAPANSASPPFLLSERQIITLGKLPARWH